jgi:hypothetical protein
LAFPNIEKERHAPPTRYAELVFWHTVTSFTKLRMRVTLASRILFSNSTGIRSRRRLDRREWIYESQGNSGKLPDLSLDSTITLLAAIIVAARSIAAQCPGKQAYMTI